MTRLVFRATQIKRFPEADIKITQPFQRIDDRFARWWSFNILQRERQDPGGDISLEIAKTRRSRPINILKIILVFANNRNAIVRRIRNDLGNDYASVGLAQRLGKRTAADKRDIQE